MAIELATTPARWSGYLSEIFQAGCCAQGEASSCTTVFELPTFMRLPESTSGQGAWVKAPIPTATRTTEARAAEWSEIDMEERLWCIPAERMKASRPHRIPLSEPAMEILRYMKAINDAHPTPSKYRLQRADLSKHPSEAIMLMRLKHGPHRYRSTASEVPSETSWRKTDFPVKWRIAALAHALQDKRKPPYQRAVLP